MNLPNCFKLLLKIYNLCVLLHATMTYVTRLIAHYSHCCDQNGSVAAECAVRCGRMWSEVVLCGPMR